MLSIGLQTLLTKRYVYPQFENFLNQSLWELHENEKKIARKMNALSKKRSFHKM